MAANLSPLAGAAWQFFGNDGVPLAGGKLYTYLAGSTTPQASYTTSTGLVANTNPIILNSAGRLDNEVWLPAGVSYKFVLNNSLDVTLGTYDNIAGINDFAAAIAGVYAALASTSDNTKGDALIGFKQSNASGFLAGASARTVNTKFQEYVSVKDFGATGDGTTDDTAALQLAINSGASQLHWPAGTYMVGSVGLTGVSNQEWIGDGNGATTVKLSATPTNNYLVSWSTKSKFLVQDMAFDFNDMTSASSVILTLFTCDDFVIDNCRLLKMDKFGIAINTGNRFTLSNNFIQKTTAANTQNQAINISTFSGAVTFARVLNNYMKNSAMNLSGYSCVVSGNKIDTFKFGGGITMQADVNTYSNIITNNTITNGSGTDVNSTVCEGIENWGKWSVISDNLIYANGGTGITNAGKQTIIANNNIFNNGLTVNSPAISALSGTVSAVFYEGSECVISGNRCFDTSGAGGTQTYGYADNSSATSYNMLVGNNFKGNKTGPANILGTVYSFSGPNVFGSAAFAGATITNGSTSTTDISMPGARMGDYVSLSYSLDLLGLNLYGYVNADNNVKVKFYNGTGGSVTIAAGTVKGMSTKPAGYADY